MKRFTIPCEFGDTKAPFHVYIGKPSSGTHPLKYQAAWLLRERGGKIPEDVMDSFEKLHKISIENNVSFEDLCVYALGKGKAQQNSEEKPKEKQTSKTTEADSDIEPESKAKKKD
jgi:hypothetical protein